LSARKPDILQVCQAGSFLLCACLAWQVTSGYEGTEFSGGWLTGPLLSMEEIGTVLFILAIVLTFVFPRVAAAIGLAASVLCLPLYFFFIAPVPFAQVFACGHEFKVEPVPGFHWGYLASSWLVRTRCYGLLLHSPSRNHWPEANPAASIGPHRIAAHAPDC
jgi:hypothetical protein